MSEVFPNIANLSQQEKRALLAQLLKKRAESEAGLYPLSYGQHAIWFMHQLAPESGAYNESFIWRIHSELNVPVLERAIQLLIDRHPVLRTVCILQDNKPVQKVQEQQKLDFSIVNVAMWSQEQIDEHLIREVYLPINLEHGPVFRAQLLTRGPKEHFLAFIAHHIAIDLWSFMVILDELSQVYHALKAGLKVVLPQPKLYYHDYVRKQAEMLAGPAGAEQWAYWQQQLAGPLPVLELPIDRVRPATQTFSGGVHTFVLDEEMTRQLKALTQTNDVTLYTVLLAAFQVLLYRYTGQEDILVGSLTNGRTQAAFDGIVGYFVNTVVLRARLEGNPSFTAFLKQTHQTVIEALAHQEYPFSLLVSQLQVQRDPSRSPLCDVTFIMEQVNRFALTTSEERKDAGVFARGATGAHLTMGDLDLEWVNIEQRKSKFDLGLEIAAVGDTISGGLQYNADLFDAGTIARFVGHFRALLRSILVNPQQSIAALPLFSTEERRSVLEEWNATALPYPAEFCLHELVSRQAEQRPDTVAVLYDGQQITYRKLDQRANKLARHLQKLGIRPGMPVGLYQERSLDMVIGLLAILKSGGVYVPLDPIYPQRRLNFILEDTQLSVVLTHSALTTSLRDSGLAIQLVCLDQAWQQIEHESAEEPVNGITSAYPAYIIYTSGSTGMPKGVMNTHRALHNRLHWMVQTVAFTADDRIAQKTPFSFDASLWEFFVPWMVGACLVMARPGGHQDSAYLASFLKEEAITILQLVPSMLHALLQERGFAACSELRHVFCGGEALSLEVLHRFYHLSEAKLHNLYGPTEASIDVTYWPTQAQWEEQVPIGRPIANTEIYLLDALLEPVPVGSVGELYVGGSNLALGYLNRSDLTAERFIPHPFNREAGAGRRLYRTGDKARYREDGRIEYLGRADQQVKLRGYRIELGEIEAVLDRYSAVKQSVVMVRKDGYAEPRLVAYIVLRDGGTEVSAALRIYLREQLPFYMIPTHILAIEELPRLNNGKIDYKALPAPQVVTQLQQEEDIATYTETETMLCKIFAEILNIIRVSKNNNFFDLGGHSLLAAQAINRIRESYAIEIPLRFLFEATTIADLAQLVDEFRLVQAIVTLPTSMLDDREDGVI